MNPKQAKVKGRETENLLVAWLREHGVPWAERRRLTGVDDQGDVAGWPGICVEIKSGVRVDLAGWSKELERETLNSQAVHGFIAIRPKGKPNPDDWVAALPLPALLRLLAEAGWCGDDVAWPYQGQGSEAVG